MQILFRAIWIKEKLYKYGKSKEVKGQNIKQSNPIEEKNEGFIFMRERERERERERDRERETKLKNNMLTYGTKST